MPPRISRRRDGSLGCFDPTVAPQLFNAAAPYWGFIRHAELVASSDPGYVVYTPITMYWADAGHDGEEEIRETGNSIFEELPPNWQIESLRPPSVKGVSDEIELLRSPSSYQNTLDTCVRIQRVLRILLAWIEWMPRYQNVQSNALVLRRRITAANDSYMGFWLNGGEERMTLALMHLGAPVFVLHEFMDGETDVPTSQLHDFLADSLESRMASPYDRVNMPSLPPIPVLLDEPGPMPTLSRYELWMSSSFFAQGPHVLGTPLPEVVPPSLSAPTPPPPSLSSQQPRPEVYPYDDDVSDYGDRSPHAPPATKDTEWIQPPDIQNTSSSSKAWEKWWFDPDLQAFIRMGKHNKDVPGKAL
ncbi:hypothetical protein GGX14DRAFT_555677 [Mycena pura]|uniref:Uncharacterized protein n=1 Tax=Mycena pura TaxID=153505 RepID=A0AAD6YRC1_9AGAR|nr:hypothetical protein GGX14DRAFT_555677 [Mycena pura]